MIPVNVGPVGQSRDGDERACYAILDDTLVPDPKDGTGEDVVPVRPPKITFRRLPYDFEKTIRKIKGTKPGS